MPDKLTATILVENSPAEGLLHEHGLSVHIVYGETRVLLDFGQSDAFAQNAKELGIDLARVSLAVLSHAHYDHADGMEAFFAHNDHAHLHLSTACAETCWSTKAGTAEPHYIGIAPNLLTRFHNRLSPTPTDRVTTIAPGIHLVPHTTPGLAELGHRAGMLLRTGDAWTPDDFAHEMTLVFELGAEPDAPLALFSSCSHAGIPAIVAETQAAFPQRPITAFVGGLHLVHSDDETILAVARTVEEAGIARVYTGHCTGSRALELLTQVLPGRVTALHPGLTFTL